MALKSSVIEAKMMRTPYAVLMLVAGLAACAPQVPDSGSGAGQQDYNTYLRDRGQLGSGNPATIPPPEPGFSPDAASAAIDAATGTQAGAAGTLGAPLDATGQNLTGQNLTGQNLTGQNLTGQNLTGQNLTGQNLTGQNGAAQTANGTTGATDAAGVPIDSTACAGRGNAFAGIKETTAEMNFVTGGVSDEQDFSAVKGRETIASDKQRIECNRAQYVTVQPGALPVRPGDTGPNIAAFALATTNLPGVKAYGRPPFYLTSPEKACAKFASPDLAQSAFLAAGGPQRDPKALDPDGDGFACSWDPRPFRIARQ